jgi:hypothetical protein
VLAGAGESARFLGRLEDAQRFAAFGADLSAKAGFTEERTQFLFQLAFIHYWKNDLGAAQNAALSANDAAQSDAEWANAAFALFIAALCAALLEDRQSVARHLAAAGQLAAAHHEDPQLWQLGATLQGFQGALDNAGRTAAERKGLADLTMNSVMAQIRQSRQ